MARVRVRARVIPWITHTVLLLVWPGLLTAQHLNLIRKFSLNDSTAIRDAFKSRSRHVVGALQPLTTTINVYIVGRYCWTCPVEEDPHRISVEVFGHLI